MTCADCAGALRGSGSRGLCPTCYFRHRRRGTLIDFPRGTRPRRDLIDDYNLLRSEGYTRRQIADRLGMKDKSLYRALRRAGITS